MHRFGPSQHQSLLWLLLPRICFTVSACSYSCHSLLDFPRLQLMIHRYDTSFLNGVNRKPYKKVRRNARALYRFGKVMIAEWPAMYEWFCALTYPPDSRNRLVYVTLLFFRGAVSWGRGTHTDMHSSFLALRWWLKCNRASTKSLGWARNIW